MKHNVQLTLIILMFSLSTIKVIGQNSRPPQRYEPTWESPEFGDISELRNKDKVYVYCEDFKMRQLIVDELLKYPSLKIVSSTDEAEFIINFTYRYVTTYSGGILGSVKTNIHSGDLIVSIAGRLDENNKVHQRIVWSSQNERKTTLGKNPAQKGAQKFLEAYKRIQERAQTQSTVSTSRPRVANGTVKVSSDPLVGAWRVTASNEQGRPIKEFTFTVRERESRLEGEMASTDGTARIEQILGQGDNFAILFSEKDGDSTLTATMTGSVTSNAMKGSISLNDGKQVFVLTFVATRIE